VNTSFKLYLYIKKWLLKNMLKHFGASDTGHRG